MPRLETLRAKAGAILLDLIRPGWAEQIDTTKLDLSSCDVCVLGQLFGSYETGAAKVFAMRFEGHSDLSKAREEAGGDAGFCVASNTKGDWMDNYKRLTTAWKREIAKRVS